MCSCHRCKKYDSKNPKHKCEKIPHLKSCTIKSKNICTKKLNTDKIETNEIFINGQKLTIDPVPVTTIGKVTPTPDITLSSRSINNSFHTETASINFNYSNEITSDILFETNTTTLKVGMNYNPPLQNTGDSDIQVKVSMIPTFTYEWSKTSSITNQNASDKGTVDDLDPKIPSTIPSICIPLTDNVHPNISVIDSNGNLKGVTDFNSNPRCFWESAKPITVPPTGTGKSFHPNWNGYFTNPGIPFNAYIFPTIGYINSFTLQEGEVLNTKITLSKMTFTITVVEGDATKLKIPKHTSVDYTVTASQEHVNLLLRLLPSFPVTKITKAGSGTINVPEGASSANIWLLGGGGGGVGGGLGVAGNEIIGNAGGNGFINSLFLSAINIDILNYTVGKGGDGGEGGTQPKGGEDSIVKYGNSEIVAKGAFENGNGLFGGGGTASDADSFGPLFPGPGGKGLYKNSDGEPGKNLIAGNGGGFPIGGMGIDAPGGGGPGGGYGGRSGKLGGGGSGAALIDKGGDGGDGALYIYWY